jgi:hypothetical protein
MHEPNVPRLVAAVCVVAALAGPASARPPTDAQVAALDSAQARDYYSSNTDQATWGQFAESACGSWRKFFGPHFTCTINWDAAREFFFAEAQKPAPKRNQTNLSFACASNSLENMDFPFAVCGDSSKCSADWKAKIKGAECRLSTADRPPSVTFEKGILVFDVSYPSKGYRPGEAGYSWWINPALYKYFPIYHDAYKASGKREDVW